MAGIIVASVGVSITPDVSSFGEKLRPSLLRIAEEIGRQVGQTIGDRIAGAMPVAGESAGTKFSDAFRARIDAAGDPTINVDVDTTGAMAKVGVLSAEVDALSGRGGRGGKGGGFGGLASAIGDAGDAIPPLVLGVGVLGAVGVPILATLATGFASVLAPIAASTIGVGLFAAAALPTLKGITDNAGPAGKALSAVKTEWAGLTAAIKPQVLQAAADALGGVAQILPALAPLLKAVGDGVVHAVEDFDTLVPTIKDFATQIAGPVSTAVDDIGVFMTDATTIFMNFTEALMPLGSTVLANLTTAFDRLAISTNNLGDNPKFQAFLAYAERMAPKVGAFFEQLATAIGHIAQALAPFGGTLLDGLTKLLTLFNAIPVDTLSKAAGAIGAISLGLKGFSVLGLGKLGPYGIALGALAAGFVLLYDKSSTFRDYVHNTLLPSVKDLGDYLKNTVEPKVKSIADKIATDLLPTLKKFGNYLVDTLYPVLKKIATDALQGLENAYDRVAGTIRENAPQLEQLGHALEDIGHAITVYVLPVLGPALKGAIEGTAEQFDIMVITVSDLVRVFDTVMNAGKAVVTFFSTTLPNAVSSAAGTVVSFVASLPGRIVGAIGSLAGSLAAAAASAWAAFATATYNGMGAAVANIAGLPGRILDAIGYLGNLLWNVGAQLVDGLWNGFKNAFGGFLHDAHNLLSKIPGIPGSPTFLQIAPAVLQPVGALMAKGLGTGFASAMPGVVSGMHAQSLGFGGAPLMPYGSSLAGLSVPTLTLDAGSVQGGASVQTRLVIEGNVYGDQALISSVQRLMDQRDEQFDRRLVMG